MTIDGVESPNGILLVPEAVARLRGFTHRVQIGHRYNIYFTVNLNPDGRPTDIRLFSAEGCYHSEISSIADELGRCFTADDPLQTFKERFAGPEYGPGGPTSNPRIQTATSVADYIYRWLVYHYRPRRTGASLSVCSLCSKPETYAGPFLLCLRCDTTYGSAAAQFLSPRTSESTSPATPDSAPPRSHSLEGT